MEAVHRAPPVYRRDAAASSEESGGVSPVSLAYPRDAAPAAAVHQAAAEPTRASIAPQQPGGSTIVADDAGRPPDAVQVRNDRYIPRTIVKRRFPERFGLHARNCAGGGWRRR
ncbi:hypothetical protein [Sorangium sp. So ce117]|uniref:hypothetical protein n=1 Tax=Sorangium sp. So ce117 TaxID=3133277 RepID=UPI003F610838